MSTRVIEPPSEEPITLEEAKLFLRVTHNAEDDLISDHITAARELAEDYQSRSFAEQTFKQTVPSFDTCIRLLRNPVNEVTKVEYVDQDYELQELDEDQYYVDSDSLPSRIYFLSRPSTAPVENAVQITFTAGSQSLDAKTKAGLLLMINHLYSRREPVVTGTATTVPLTVQWLWDQGVWSHYGNV